MAVKNKPPRVPDHLMIPLGARITLDTGTCADSWSDSVIAQYRTALPTEYHAFPLDALRKQFINIRKKGTEGYRVKGTGPRKGSRKKTKRQTPPKWYLDYLKSDSWKSRRHEWIEFWGHRCCVCYAASSDVILDVHHRTYERCPHNEAFTDCVVLCRRCHELFEHVPDEQGGPRKLLF